MVDEKNPSTSHPNTLAQPASQLGRLDQVGRRRRTLGLGLALTGLGLWLDRALQDWAGSRLRTGLGRGSTGMGLGWD